MPGTVLGATVNKENKVSYEVYNLIYFFPERKKWNILVVQTRNTILRKGGGEELNRKAISL